MRTEANASALGLAYRLIRFPRRGGVIGGPGSGVNSDGPQRKRINQIYEQERCADGRVVSIHTGC